MGTTKIDDYEFVTSDDNKTGTLRVVLGSFSCSIAVNSNGLVNPWCFLEGEVVPNLLHYLQTVCV